MKDDERRIWRAVEEPPDDTEGHARWTVESAPEDAEARAAEAPDDETDDEPDDTVGHLRF
jgi:hypothetical protein